MRTAAFFAMGRTVARTHDERAEASARCYCPLVNQRLCPRCGTPAQPGGTVCERCELPLEGPAPVRYNPAGLALPSPIQGHATVLVGVVAAVALLVAGAWFLYHGVR